MPPAPSIAGPVRFASRIRLPLIALALAAVATASYAAARAQTPYGVPSPRPTVELIETRPVETTVGNPELRTAREVWLELIRNAGHGIDLEHFYLSDWPGEPLGEVLDELGRAAARGVRVRLLLDAGFRRTYPQPAESLGTVKGIEVRWIAIRRITGGVQHAKAMIVDDQTVVVGSQNLDWRALEHIHELGVVVRDPRVAAAFGQVFELDWQAAGLQAAGRDSLAVRALAHRAPVAGPLPFRVERVPGDVAEVWPGWSPKTFAPDSNRWDRDQIVRVVDAARHEIVLQSLHLSAEDRGIHDPALLDALRRAAARGVRVKAAISDWTADGSGIRALQEFSRVPNVEARLSVIPDWSGGYIPFARLSHAKYLVADTLWTWVGTSNLEPGYFHSSRNLGVVLKSATLAGQARRVFESVWTMPTAVRVRPDTTYAPRVHRDTPPPGMKAYGR